MSALVEVKDNGEVRLPAELHSWKPHTQLQVVAEGEKLVIEPAQKAATADESATLWYSRTPAERSAALREWVESLPKREGPPISDEALRRENMYD